LLSLVATTLFATHHPLSLPHALPLLLANHPRTGQPTPTSQQNWPSSTGLLEGNNEAGAGGGGGGGGQYSCDLYVDLQKSIVTHRDRKSTRLNSSHVSISYAVFCLKKK